MFMYDLYSGQSKFSLSSNMNNIGETFNVNTNTYCLDNTKIQFNDGISITMLLLTEFNLAT